MPDSGYYVLRNEELTVTLPNILHVTTAKWLNLYQYNFSSEDTELYYSLNLGLKV